MSITLIGYQSDGTTVCCETTDITRLCDRCRANHTRSDEEAPPSPPTIAAAIASRATASDRRSTEEKVRAHLRRHIQEEEEA